MRRTVAMSAAFVVAFLSGPRLAWADGCSPTDLSSFSRLSQVVSHARANARGQLLAAWLLRSRSPEQCQFVFRIDVLMQDGSIHSMNFDARTLEPVDIRDGSDWIDVDSSGTGADRGADRQTRLSDSDRNTEDRDAVSRNDDSDDDDRGGGGNSGPGSGDDSGEHDSSGRGGGDDRDGSDSSGSGSGSDDD